MLSLSPDQPAGEQSKQLQMYCMHDLETGEGGRLGGFKHLRG